MIRKFHKSARKRLTKKAGSSRTGKSVKTRGSTVRKVRRRYSFPKTVRQTAVHRKALAALARMRRENLSLAKATRLEHIKPSTFLRYVGSAIHRSGPGKPWRVSKTDRFAERMTILTAQGPAVAVVHGSQERTRLARYDIALRKWRAGQDSAEKGLMAFKGQTVGGHELITDPELLIQLEEAGQLDFDVLYFSVGGGS